MQPSIDTVPFIFDSSGNVSVTSSAAGFLAVPEGLYCPHRRPFLIDEFRFTTYSAPFPLLRATIYVGRVTICEDMPLELLGRPLDLSAETDLAYAGAIDHTTAFHVWRLPKPLLLPKGARVDVKFAYNLNSSLLTTPPSPIVPSVAMLGRTLPAAVPIPRTVNVPYAAKWIASLAPTTQGAVLTDQSTPADLRNNSDRPLFVQRFSGYLTGVDVNGNSLDDAQGAAQNAKVRFFGEGGSLGVRDQTPVGVLFHHGNRSWIANTVLRPGGYYIADIDYTTTVLPAQRIFTPQLAIGMIGHREMSITEFGIPLE